MGSDRCRCGPGSRRRGTLRPPLVARVVPDIPTFAVDAGFAYAVPPGRDVSVGSIVRVPLGGRKLRGYVVDVDEGEGGDLKELLNVSGDVPVFDRKLLETLRWAAHHYVAPVATLLSRAAPPNLPRHVDGVSYPAVPTVAEGPLGRFAKRAAEGKKPPATYLLTGDRWSEHVLSAAAPVVEAGRSVLVVAATAVEARGYAEQLSDLGSRVVTATSDLADRQVTAAWVRAATVPGTVLVGTQRAAFWPLADPGLAVIIEEGRRGMKDRQTPTVHAREILRTRASVERFGLLYVGRVPTAEVLRAGTDVVRAPGRNRIWQLVEVVDRSEDPPGTGILSQRVRSAVRHAVSRGEKTFLFTHRHGYAPAHRCVNCRALQRCPACGARPEPGDNCARCGAALGGCATCGSRRFEPLGAGVGRVTEEARRIVERVGKPGEDCPVWVGTERDLADLPPVDLAVAVDADGLTLGTNYRAAEDALRILARLAASVPFGRGKRLMVQTSQPHGPVIAALRRGEPLEFLEAELQAREALGFPPAGELIVLEVRNPPAAADEWVREAAGSEATVFGPAEVNGGRRWLLQGRDFGGVRTRLRGTVQQLRDGRASVRLDVDPLDL